MPASRLHPFWRLVLCGVALLVAVLIIQSVGVGVLLAFSASLGMGKLPLDQRIMQIATNYGLHLTVLSYPIGVGILYLFRTKVDGYSWRSLGFSRVRALPDAVRGALTALLTLSVLFSLMWVTGTIRFGGWSSDVQTHSGLYALGSLLAFALAFGAVGLFEETVFRGYALANLRQFAGWWGAVVIQAAVFAVIHLGNGIGNPDVFRAALAGLPSLFMIAVFFALSYRKTGSLWFPIGFHIAWDWLLGCVFSLPVSGIPTFRLFDVQETGTSFLSGGRFGAESSFFLIPLLIAMIYALWQVPDHPRAVANLDAPEGADAPREEPVYAPIGSASSSPTSESEEEESRENRYNARFGSATGFDSDMLRELKQMNEAREQAEREKAEAERAARRAEEMRLEEIRRAQIAAQTLAATETPEATTVTEEASEPVVAETTAQESEKAVAETQVAIPVAIPETPSAPREVAPPVIPAAPAPVAARVPAAPPAPVPPTPSAPAVPASPVTQQQEAAPISPSPAPEAPPKKARPRW